MLACLQDRLPEMLKYTAAVRLDLAEGYSRHYIDLAPFDGAAVAAGAKQCAPVPEFHRQSKVLGVHIALSAERFHMYPL